MGEYDWTDALGESGRRAFGEAWIPVGSPGFSGDSKAKRRALLDARFGADGWRWGFVVRGKIVGFPEAIAEYEESYRRYLRDRPTLVAFLASECGNVYDWGPANVFDADYSQPGAHMNHFQDISVRRVIAELAADPAWPAVVDSGEGPAELVDLGTGQRLASRRARGFSGSGLLEIRGPESPGFMLSPAVVPAWDPALLVPTGRREWYHDEGCAHLSVEAFWQSSKVVLVRLDRFSALGPARARPLEGL